MQLNARKVIQRIIHWNRSSTPTFLTNYFNAPPASPRALLLYMMRPFTEPKDWLYTKSRHANNLHSYLIAHLLAKRGYAVDIASYKIDALPVQNLNYDLILGHGQFCRSLAATYPSTTKKIYLTTGLATEVARKNQAMRLADVERRRGCRISPRFLGAMKPDELRPFDAVVCIGNDYTANSHWQPGVDMFPINNLPIRSSPPIPRIMNNARRHFMFFASSGQVLKGLDLVLETFSMRPDLELHVCGRHESEKKFIRCYESELYRMPNIRTHGEQMVGSKKFVDLCKTCAFVILPSCSEGQPGTVIDCMHAGLIPVVTRQCGIDLGEFGYLIPDTTVEAVDKVVSDIQKENIDELKGRSLATLKAASDYFSENAFQKRWHEIFDSAGV